MNKILVETPSTSKNVYPIIIGENVFENAPSLIKEATKAKKLLIVTNPTVEALYYEKFVTALKDSFLIEKVVLDDGEKFKNVASLDRIWTKAIETKLERKDAIVALGGGVIGDVAGFAAASYLRGIDFIQVPTTLLAQVDSSVGGKVAINHACGKNLMGAFYQPKLVLSDTSTLKTLPVREIKTGLAEVVKYAFIEKTCNVGEKFGFIDFLKSKKNEILNLQGETLSDLISICCKLKAGVVSQDEKEQGLRAILNFGHTIAHSIEKCTHYNLFTHGEAVAVGIRAAFELSLMKKLIGESYFNEGINLLDEYGFDCKIPENVSVEELYQSMFSDKKVENRKIRFILATDKASVGIFDDVEKDLIIKVLENLKK